MSVNKAFLLGRLGKDPELRQTANGLSIVTFSLATDGRKKEDGPTWHNIVAFGKTADAMHEYLTKGRQVFIEGRISNETYEKDGQKKSTSKVIVDSFSFVGDRGEKQQDPGQPSNGDDGDMPF